MALLEYLYGSAWTVIDSLLIIWKSDLSDKIKWDFFQAVTVSVLLYGCTTWTLTKLIEEKLDGNYTRTLWVILNKSEKQYHMKQQLYSHLPPISKTIQVRQITWLWWWWHTCTHTTTHIYTRDVEKVLSLIHILDLLYTFHFCMSLTCTEIKSEI